jgi:hypothetical protein
LFDLYRKLGINSTYVPTFADGNNKYVTFYRPKPERKVPQRKGVGALTGPFKRLFSSKGKEEGGGEEDEEEKDEDHKQKEPEPEHKTYNQPPPKPSLYQPPPPKKHLLPKRIIAVFGPESSGTTFLTSVLGVATGAFPEEGRWTQVLSPNPQESRDPTNPRMKWKFERTIPERATTDDGALEVQHLSLPSGWVCQKKMELNKINVVEAFIPAECMRYEMLPDLDLRLAEQIWYNKHAPIPKKPGSMTDTVEDFDWDEWQELRRRQDEIYLDQCRDEVKISQHAGSCGAKCGQNDLDGLALYPNRYFVNITR